MEDKNTIHRILSQSEDFLVIGLTGRMGSGCSKVAEVLATPFEKMEFPYPKPQPGARSLSKEERITRIIAEYAEAHWMKFDVIQAGAIIATFILNDDQCFFKDLANQADTTSEKQREFFFAKVLSKIYESTVQMYIKAYGLDESSGKAEYIINSQSDSITTVQDASYHTVSSQEVCLKKDIMDTNYLKQLDDLLKKTLDSVNNQLPSADSLRSISFQKFCSCCTKFFNERKDTGTWNKSHDWNTICDTMDILYRVLPVENSNIHRRKYFDTMDRLLELFSIHFLFQKLSTILHDENPEIRIWEWLQKVNQSIDPNESTHKDVSQFEKYIFVKYLTTWFGKSIREYIAANFGDDVYARLFQRYGQMIRYDRKIKIYTNSTSITHSVASKLPKKMESIIRSLCHNHTEPNNVTILSQSSHVDADENVSPGIKKDIFAIPRRINQHIKVLRHPFDSNHHRPVRIVIDSIKNIFEAVYLRYRYSAFYLWAITTDTPIRERRLSNKHFTDIQVEMMDWNEYPDKGRDVILRADKIIEKTPQRPSSTQMLEKEDKNNWAEICSALMKHLKQSELEFYLGKFSSKAQKAKGKHISSKTIPYDEFDRIRRDFFRNGTYVFYAQDIDNCVCNADVYLFNNATSETDIVNNNRLLEAVVRNVSLAMYPCLVRPTPIERCMQIALSAKVNSGCLSRQVGAVVTDAQYNILAIGWNDVPCGEVSCACKNFTDICSSADSDAYSDYELHNKAFRDRLVAYSKMYPLSEINLRGLPYNYCFKDIHKNGKDPMRSRAMHAEEKALALCGKEAEGGYLFTTSSPCEMCSKNAKNHKIKKIYYLEAYPGISQAQYTNSGALDNRAELILFSGAVGRAYMQMYSPLLPHKDVLEYLGIDFKKNLPE